MNAPYGYCPRCGAPGVARERRIDGNDQCANGHDYPSSTALVAALPGAAFAPVVAWSARSGHRLATAEEVALCSLYCGDPEDQYELYAVGDDGGARRLSCSDPDDQRSIWRRAALALGASEEEAITAVLVRYDSGWALGVLGKPGRKTAFRVLLRMPRAANVQMATAALCLSVWGPR